MIEPCPIRHNISVSRDGGEPWQRSQCFTTAAVVRHTMRHTVRHERRHTADVSHPGAADIRMTAGDDSRGG